MTYPGKEQRIREQIAQATTELEQSPRMEAYTREQLAIHRNSCPNCLSRQFCETKDAILTKVQQWERIAYWAKYSENCKEDWKDEWKNNV